MRILFVTHETSRTGAPGILLYFIRWLRENRKDIKFDLLALQEGPLLTDMRAACDHTYVWNRRSTRGGIDKVIMRVFFHLSRLTIRWKIRNARYDLVYVNSAASCHVLDAIRSDMGDARLLVHVHELEVTLQRFCKRATEKWLHQADCVVGVSNLVIDNLIQNHGVPQAVIHKVHEFIPDSNVDVEQAREDIRATYGIPKQAVLIGGCGTLDWRKGPDLFIQVAKMILESTEGDTEFHFLWMGGKPGTRAWVELHHDLRQCGIIDRVQFVGLVANASDFFHAFDMFLMPSREDPFPLVCLEAGQAGCPIVCFKDAIGSTEYLSDKTGAVVPYLDTSAMANETWRLSMNEEERERAGREIRDAVRPFTLETCATKLIDIVEELVQFDVRGEGR